MDGGGGGVFIHTFLFSCLLPTPASLACEAALFKSSRCTLSITHKGHVTSVIAAIYQINTAWEWTSWLSHLTTANWLSSIHGKFRESDFISYWSAFAYWLCFCSLPPYITGNIICSHLGKWISWWRYLPTKYCCNCYAPSLLFQLHDDTPRLHEHTECYFYDANFWSNRGNP